MKAVFMGTPDFAVPVLDAMLKAGIDVAAVVTQPDKTKGRGRKLIYSPVKELALSRGIEVLQPVGIKKDPVFQDKIRAIAPDVIVVVAFGQIIPQSLLDIPRIGCVNVHGSLLPKYRGAAPIQWAILKGEKETGVTTMLMDAGLDTGDMLLKAVVPIAKDETSESLSGKLSEAGADLLIRTLEGLEKGTISPVPQDDSRAGMYASMLSKEMGEIDFSLPAEQIDRQIRGLYPWPGTYTHFNGRLLRIWKADIGPDAGPGAEPGTVVNVTKKNMTVQTGQGALIIGEVQLEGKKRMDCASFLNGNKVLPGMALGE